MGRVYDSLSRLHSRVNRPPPATSGETFRILPKRFHRTVTHSIGPPHTIASNRAKSRIFEQHWIEDLAPVNPIQGSFHQLNPYLANVLDPILRTRRLDFWASKWSAILILCGLACHPKALAFMVIS